MLNTLLKRLGVRGADPVLALTDPNYLNRFIWANMLKNNPPWQVLSKPKGMRLIVIDEPDGKYGWLREANRDRPHHILSFSRMMLNSVFKYLFVDYLASPTLKDIGYLNEIHKPEYDEARQQYYDYCKTLLQKLHRWLPIDAFLVPKVHDAWIIEFNRALKEVGIPLVVTEREPVSPPSRQQVWSQHVRHHINVQPDLLCVAGDHHQEFYELAGVDPVVIRQTGALKTDFWGHPTHWPDASSIHSALKNSRHKLLFFAFGLHTYKYPYWFEKDDGRTWSQLAEEVNRSMGDALVANPETLQLVYKTGSKPQRDIDGGAVDILMDRVAGMGDQTLLFLNDRYKAEELIVNVDLIVSFQTTATIEAMFTDKPIIYPGWTDTHDYNMDSLVPFFDTDRSGLIHAQSEAHFKELLDTFMEDPDALKPTPAMLEARKGFRFDYLGVVDGNAGLRVLEEVEHYVALH